MNPRLRIVLVLLVATLTTLGTMHLLPDGKVAKRDAGPNLLFIIVDTLRPDWLSCYGMDHFQTPHIDALAKRGTLFTDVACQCPSTLPSHASIFTSTYPDQHGVINNAIRLPDKARTLAEVLTGAGYRTAGFISNVVLEEHTRIGQGFETWDDTLPDVELNRDQPERIAEKTTTAALNWLQDNQAGFFLFVHYQDPHGPYLPPEAFRNRVEFTTGLDLPLSGTSNPLDAIPAYQSLHGETSVDAYLSGYAGEILYTDQQIGRLLEGVEQLGVLEDTIIVFTADHGEALGEHGRYFQHATSLHQPQVAIPLVFAGPGIHSGAGNRFVQSIDIMPTILDLLDTRERPRMQGRSLAPDLTRSHAPEGEPTGYGLLFNGRFVRKGKWKLTLQREEEAQASLFDLARDPGELVNLSGQYPDETIRLQKELKSLERNDGTAPSSAEKITDPETLRRLEALGYIIP